MKPIAQILAGSTFALLLATGSALAACPTTTGSINAQPQKGIAKDGTHAPLESGANSQLQKGAASTGTTTSSMNQAPQKDGKTMPLAGKEGSGDPNLATSQQDVEAQQKGDQTAMAKAEDCKQ